MIERGFTMRKIIEKLQEQEFTTREYVFIGFILFLGGIVLGMLLSPKGKRVIGSHNGNGNIGYAGDMDEVQKVKKNMK